MTLMIMVALAGVAVAPVAASDGKGLLSAIEARLTPEAQNVLDNLMAIGRENGRRTIVSWAHPWAESGSACAVANNRGELRGVVEKHTGQNPILYFTDFYFCLGTWQSADYYNRSAVNMEGFIKKAYDRWHSVPVFSWHLGNPYAPHRRLLPAQAYGADYRWRYSCEGYPQEHRYVVKEILEGTGSTCGTGRADETAEKETLSFPNPRAWYDWHLDRVCAFLQRLTDRNGRSIPVVVRLFHECEDDWQWWGAKSVSRDDYVKLFRWTVSEIRRRTGLKSLLFMYSPDRHWKTCSDPDAVNDFLYRYPGNDVVDIIGFDDYSIGKVPKGWKGPHEEGIRASLQETIRKARLVSGFSQAHGKPAGIVETGIKPAGARTYELLREVMSAEGVAFSFFNTWGGDCTVPKTSEGIKAWRKFLSDPSVIVAGRGVNLTERPPRWSEKFFRARQSR